MTTKSKRAEAATDPRAHLLAIADDVAQLVFEAAQATQPAKAEQNIRQ